MSGQETAEMDRRIAGAPASWGICEVDGWGRQLAPDVVLDQMHEIGMRTTELGPEGYLGATPPELRVRLNRHGMTAWGAFCPFVLHGRFEDLRAAVDSALDVFHAVGARVMVISASPGNENTLGYDANQRLADDEWKILVQNLDRVVDRASERGVQACLQPHVGTMVEPRSEVYRLVSDSDVGLCLDSGHLLVGGTDPVMFARAVPHGVTHVHIPDETLDCAASTGLPAVGLAAGGQPSAAHVHVFDLPTDPAPLTEFKKKITSRGPHLVVVLSIDHEDPYPPRRQGVVTHAAQFISEPL